VLVARSSQTNRVSSAEAATQAGQQDDSPISSQFSTSTMSTGDDDDSEAESDSDWHMSAAEDLCDDDDDDSASTAGSVLFDITDDSVPSPVKQRKYFVFESSLRQLFLLCFVCLSPCRVLVRQLLGSFVSVEQRCSHGHVYFWDSQPCHGSMPLGNLLLSACIFFSGVSPVRILNSLRFANIPVMNIRTYNRIQSSYLVMAVKKVWQTTQADLLQSKSGKLCNVAGDGRCCSPGHTAKFCSYTVMDIDDSKILDVQLIQVNEVNSSYAMELEGLKRCLTFLLQYLNITSITTDRHCSVQKYLRETFPQFIHYFDIWHIAKSVRKKIIEVSKRRDCSILHDWAQSVSNHLYWCAASSSGNGDLIVAKWTSILRHICDIHTGHGLLFDNCAHGLLEPRLWLHAGSKAHKELEIIVTNKLLCRDIKKLAHSGQTSALESFHKIVIFFAPKSVHYFYAAMEARILIAALHFNENSQRPQAVTRNDQLQWSVSFPKARSGQAVVKPVTVPATFHYVDKLITATVELRDAFPTYKSAKQQSRMLSAAHPPLIASLVNRPDKDNVIQSHKSRFNKAAREAEM